MIAPEPSKSEQVDQLLRNAELRDELEPLYDESIGCVNVNRMSTRCENEFLESMLEWERAPMLAIRDWFEPQLNLPVPDQVDPKELSGRLAQTIELLYEKQIILDFTDHLSDLQLYTLIYRDILPSYEKKIARRGSFLHWDCANVDGDPETWLRYYANDQERDMWQQETGDDLPPYEEPPYRRKMPQAPL